MPYADWCPHCVRFRAKADKHVRAKPDVREDSVCCMDFAKTGRRTPAQFEGHTQEKLVVLVLKDSHTGAVHAIPTPAKGGTIAFKYLVAETCGFLNYCGHQTCTIRSDSEPACLALQRGIKAFRSKMGLQTHLEQTEASDHQGNEAEQSIDGIRQLAGCILDQFEERAETTIGSSHPMHAYAWRHAAWLHMRMSRQNDLSAFHVINGRPYLGKLVCFGETVFARVKRQVGQARKQKTQAEALSAGGEEAGEAAHEQVAEVPSQQGASEHPMPFPEHLLPDDAMLSELVPRVVRHAAEHAGGDAPARKKLRLDALQVSAHDAEMFHLDKSIELVDESAEQFLDCEDQDDNQSEQNSLVLKLTLTKELKDDIENGKYEEGWFYLTDGRPVRIDWDVNTTYSLGRDEGKAFNYRTALRTRYEEEQIVWEEMEFYECAEEWRDKGTMVIVPEIEKAVVITIMERFPRSVED
ncbi:GIP [Symbiodinium natans]|uniref:GIP protein n=1 Tax=Symbiodinium natans TaxID=878477 RepID=A0A812ILC7_9DINO|nr:GIP [Symbiodinium natans]